MRTKLALLAGKFIKETIKILNLGAGATWPGEVALKLDPSIIKKLLPPNKTVILVAGTNGKTTTAKLIKDVIEANGHKVVHNLSGANLLNGIASILVEDNTAEYFVFEVDENSLVKVAQQTNPDYVVLLNLFRDQLDRYGEVDSIADKWEKIWAGETKKSVHIVNADDPQIAFSAREGFTGEVIYFGLGDKKYFSKNHQHATDSIFCPMCRNKLIYSGVYFSHLGEWKCPVCKFTHPKNSLNSKDIKTNLDGVYNIYNFLAAAGVCQKLGLTKIQETFDHFVPAFGRQEEINGIKILLSKNPTGFNESLRTAIAGGGSILLELNDRIPDGRDVSWIWDVDFEMLKDYKGQVYVWGDRKEDLIVRLKYAGVEAIIQKNYNVKWVLCTYSAMLETRRDLTGKKIL